MGKMEMGEKKERKKGESTEVAVTDHISQSPRFVFVNSSNTKEITNIKNLNRWRIT